MPKDKKKVLFHCTGNSARSQMAEGLLRHLAGDRFDVYSAGTKPSVVNPFAIRAMAEIGIDIAGHRSKSVTEFLGQRLDHVITVCDNAKESCPAFPGACQRIHWSFEDPAACEGDDFRKEELFRAVRDQIRSRIIDFVKC